MGILFPDRQSHTTSSEPHRTAAEAAPAPAGQTAEGVRETESLEPWVPIDRSRPLSLEHLDAMVTGGDPPAPPSGSKRPADD